MESLSKEDFLEKVRQHFREDIALIIRQNFKRNSGKIEFKSLESGLILITSKWKIDKNLTMDDWLDLIYDVTPEIYEKMFLINHVSKPLMMLRLV